MQTIQIKNTKHFAASTYSEGWSRFEILCRWSPRPSEVGSAGNQPQLTSDDPPAGAPVPDHHPESRFDPPFVVSGPIARPCARRKLARAVVVGLPGRERGRANGRAMRSFSRQGFKQARRGKGSCVIPVGASRIKDGMYKQVRGAAGNAWHRRHDQHHHRPWQHQYQRQHQCHRNDRHHDKEPDQRKKQP